jgi:hypothetical protein
LNKNNFIDDKVLANLRSRTDAKLRYAKIHLDELKALGRLGGSDFDRAHQESFLYHLLGAKESFLLELNAYYKCGLPSEELTAGKLRTAIKSQKKHSDELAELHTLENDSTSWLFHAKKMRDHSTHVAGISRAYHLGGPADGQIWLENPKTKERVEKHFVEKFFVWLANMKKLLEQLRTSAVEKCL